MSSQLMRQYIDILQESQKNINEKVRSPYAVGMAVAKKKAGYSDSPAHDLPKSVIKKAHDIAKKIDEDDLEEKWGKPTTVSPQEKGKYEGKTKEELLKRYNALKKTGPHKKGSKEYGTMRELAFAIRAKTGWGKVKD